MAVTALTEELSHTSAIHLLAQATALGESEAEYFDEDIPVSELSEYIMATNRTQGSSLAEELTGFVGNRDSLSMVENNALAAVATHAQVVAELYRPAVHPAMAARANATQSDILRTNTPEPRMGFRRSPAQAAVAQLHATVFATREILGGKATTPRFEMNGYTQFARKAHGNAEVAAVQFSLQNYIPVVQTQTVSHQVMA